MSPSGNRHNPPLPRTPPRRPPTLRPLPRPILAAARRRRAYPVEFVNAMTAAGFLAALIPEQYGGGGASIAEASVILEEVNRSGGNAGVCHAQMYIMGALVRHGSAEQRAQWLPPLAEGRLRLQAFGVTEPTAGSDTTRIQTRAERDGDEYVVTGQKIWTSRAQHSDLMLLLARTTPLDAVTKRTEGLSLFLVDLRNGGRTQVDNPPARDDDQPSHHRGLFRRPARARGQPHWRRGQGLPLHPRRHERRTHPDRGRVGRRRRLVHRAVGRVRQPAHRLRPAHRPEPGRAVPHRPGLRQPARRRPDALAGGASVRR